VKCTSQYGLRNDAGGKQTNRSLTVFISECILGFYYVAELNQKAGDRLCWSLVQRAFNGRITRIPSAQVPRKVWRRAYHLLIENEGV
jgi:hypothetical protein